MSRLTPFIRRALTPLLSLALVGFIGSSTAQPQAASSTTATAPAKPTTVLRLFAGGQAQRPDLLRKVLDDYQRRHPGIRVDISVGAATSDLQRKYLSTLLGAGDPTYDAVLIDVVNPPQYAAAGWIQPLDTWLPDRQALLDTYLPVYTQADQVGGRLVALPAQADALFLYYRKDLLARHGIAPPDTWEQLAQAAQRIQAAEKAAGRPELQGLSIQGAPIEGAVCTFLLPYWSQGKDLLDAEGRLSLDKPAAVNGLQQWRDLIARGVLKKNIAEVTTIATVNDFRAGHVVFAVNWGFAWRSFESAPDTQVSGKVGMLPIPAVAGGQRATCVGGWQWALSAYSRHKPETAALLRHLASAEVSRFFALEGGALPTHRHLYRDPALLARMPWLRMAEPAVLSARSRPVTPRYAEVSSALRVTTSSVLGGSVTPEQGVDDIQRRLQRVLR